VARRRLDREAHGLEPTDELADVLPHLGPLGRARSQHAKSVLGEESDGGGVAKSRCGAVCEIATCNEPSATARTGRGSKPSAEKRIQPFASLNPGAFIRGAR
jgi:hypothetical protein